MRDWLVKADQWINRHRPAALLGTLALSIAVAALVNWWTDSDLFRQFFFPRRCDPEAPFNCDPVEWKELFQASFLALGLPIAFLLWHWRDRNVRDQIENARKDINLKEFQELQLRAAGAISTDIPEKSRQTLWISALHQMRGYLIGEYGPSFRRPALEVYSALMERQKRSEKVDNPNEVNPEPDMGLPDSVYRTVRDIIFEEWKSFFWEDFSQGMGWPLQGRSLRRIRLPIGAILNNLDFSRTDFSESDFGSVSLSRARLWDTNFQGCNLRSAILTDVEGDGINLDQADMAGVAAQHADFSNGSFKETQFHGAKLSGASFFKGKGSDCVFVNTSLEAANFNGAVFNGVVFENARLNGAKFVSANIFGGRIDRADLSGCDFSFALLDGFHPTKSISCEGAIVNGRTKLPYPERAIYEKLLSTERAETIALWREHGALVVEPVDPLDEADDDAIVSQRSLNEAITRIGSNVNESPPF